MRYEQLGEEYGIGATCHYITYGGKKIIIDCGVAFVNRNGKRTTLPPRGNFLAGHEIDAIIFTHSHADHFGAAPRLVAEHPEALVILSGKTFESAPVIFEDAFRIQNGEAREANPDSEFADMIFDRKDMRTFWENPNLEFVTKPVWLPFNDDSGVQIGLTWSGHTPQAMMVCLYSPNERPVFFTADSCAHDQEIEKGVMLPDDDFLRDFLDLPDLVMVTECTNGYRDAVEDKIRFKNRQNWSAVEKAAMARRLNKEALYTALKEIKNHGGQALFPVFAQNRASNIVLMMVEKGIVPHVDGMARDFLRIEVPKIDELIATGKVILIEKGLAGVEHRGELATGQSCCGHSFTPIVAPSAVIEGGYSVGYAAAMLPNKNNGVIFTGHIFENSIAAQLRKIEKGRTIKLPIRRNGQVTEMPVNVRCEVYHFDFTSHDYQGELLERIWLAGPRDVILHHAGNHCYRQMKTRIRKTADKNTKVHFGLNRREIVL